MFNPVKCNQALGSYQKWRVGNDIRKMLLDDNDIVALIGNKIFPLVAPENTIGDFIVYERQKYSKEITKMGVISDSCNIGLYIISDNYDNGVRLAELVDNALIGKYKNEDGVVLEISLENSSESFQDLKYVQYLLLNIK